MAWRRTPGRARHLTGANAVKSVLVLASGASGFDRLRQPFFPNCVPEGGKDRREVQPRTWWGEIPLMARLRAPKNVQVGLNLPFLQVSGTWEPNDDERKAAWELHVELVTRISAVELGADEGLLSEALSSLYTFFSTTRDILRHYGPDVAEPKPGGQFNFGVLAVAMLNYALRPLLAQWHPALDDWESRRPADRSRREHELAWDRAEELRAALDATRNVLAQYARLMADVCGIPDMLEVPQPEVATET
jgi:hypothetical protein